MKGMSNCTFFLSFRLSYQCLFDFFHFSVCSHGLALREKNIHTACICV